MGKVALYVNTIRYLKPEQLWHQATKRIGKDCPLIKGYKSFLDDGVIRVLPGIRELDYDEEFLSRYSVDDLMRHEVKLLHSKENLDINGTWFFENRSPLWNHNLHYFEYLFALAKQYEDTKEHRYLDNIKDYISCWIENNPVGNKNSAWECYPIALRVPNWIDLYGLLQDEINQDEVFKKRFINSLFEQYVYLLNHLERHLLANHYFEDLKALVIASVFFEDDKVCEVATEKLLGQCREQIFGDGMQYERSPMYQKILLEDLIRVEVALKSIGKANNSIRQYVKKMLDVSYSLEFGLDRLPLFNDCGKNITKSLNALIEACEKRLGIKPDKKNSFPDSGFYVFEFGNKWKLVVDGGQPGPDYSPGHAHCEMMSYELFHKGKPIIVNCGTYAYQCEQRRFFKSTEASNTVKVSGTEQSECWSSFRMARRARLKDIHVQEQGIRMQMTDYLGHRIQRMIAVNSGGVEITDECDNEEIESYLHFPEDVAAEMIDVQKGETTPYSTPYAEEFGLQRQISAIRISGRESVIYTIRIKDK